MSTLGNVVCYPGFAENLLYVLYAILLEVKEVNPLRPMTEEQ